MYMYVYMGCVTCVVYVGLCGLYQGTVWSMWDCVVYSISRDRVVHVGLCGLFYIMGPCGLYGSVWSVWDRVVCVGPCGL